VIFIRINIVARCRNYIHLSFKIRSNFFNMLTTINTRVFEKIVVANRSDSTFYSLSSRSF